MGREFLPASDAGLLAWAQNFTTVVQSAPDAVGLSDDQSTAFKNATTAYASVYQTAYNPATRTAPNIAAKDAAKAIVVTMARQYVRICQAYPELSDDQRRALKITVRKSPAPVPPPSEEPAVDVMSVVNRTVTVKIHSTATSDRRAKPSGVLGAKIYTFTGTEYPSDPSQWTYVCDTTKTTYDIVFADSTPAGAQVWITAQWYSRTAATGPGSVPISTNLQGGGTSATSTMKVAA